MTTLAPRVVVVHRASEYDELRARHGTRAAASFFLSRRGLTTESVSSRHDALEAALRTVSAAVPADWRRGRVHRDDLSRFLFEPGDIVVAVGQDGLVANVAKYLTGQPVIGVDPEPGRNPGVLARHRPEAVAGVLAAAAAGRAVVEERTMVAAVLDDGQRLLGLNEVFLGHASHQSARYQVTTPDGRRERQSSSGVVVGTGTGATGWCASIAAGRPDSPSQPAPNAPALCWFVREAWPSPATGTTCTAGLLADGEQLEITGESERLVAFADGMESDHLTLTWGQRVTVGVAAERLHLVTAPAGHRARGRAG